MADMNKLANDFLDSEDENDEKQITPEEKPVISKETVESFLDEGAERSASLEDINAFLDSDMEEASAWREFKYGFSSMPTDTENAGIWLESRFPIGRIMGWDSDGDWFWYKSPKDLYGEDFDQLTPEQRRERIIDVRNREIADEYRDVILSVGEEGTGWTTFGKVVGAASTPTTLAPATQSLKGATAIGAFLGAEETALYGLAQHGKIDPTTVAVGTAVGGALPPTFVGVGKGLKYAASGVYRVTPKGREAHARATALNQLHDFEDQLAVEIARGEPPVKAYRNVKDNLGFSEKDVQNMASIAGRKIEIPGKKKARDIAKALNDGGVRDKVSVPNPIDRLLGVLQTRVAKINPKIATELNRFEYSVHVKTHNALKETHDFVWYLKKLKGSEYRIVSKALANGDFDIVADSLRHRFGDKAVESFEKTKKILDDYHDRMVKAGYDSGKVPNYFPRLVKDRKLLLEKLGRDEKTALEEALDVAERKAFKDGRTLTESERSDVINKFLRGYTSREGRPGFTKDRKIIEVTDDLLEAYSDPVHSLHTYIRRMTNDLERREFFGRLGVDMKKAHQKALREERKAAFGEKTKGLSEKELDLLQDRNRALNASIGELIRKELDAGTLKREGLLELESMLSARFQYGDRSPSGWIQDVKNVLYATVLGNPISAGTQLGDVGLALYMNGFRHTISAMVGKKEIRMIDLGLDDAAQELSSDIRRSSRFLNSMLEAGQFKRIDRFGKDTLLNGALRKFRSQANTEASRKVLAKKWRRVFGDDLEEVIEDLRTGNMSENVKFMLWNELSDIQPISLSQVPEVYLRHPDGRIFYMLKTFTLRQMDILRRDIIRQYKEGNKSTAIKNAAAFVTFFGAANMGADATKDFLLGRETDVSDAFVYNLWGMVGVTNYLAGKVSGGELSEGIKDTVAPPLRVMDDLWKAFATAMNSDKKQDMDFVKHFPVFGKIVHNWFLGGLEKNQEWKEKERREKERDEYRKYGL